MHPHQLEVLRAELKRPEYQGLSPEEAFRLVNAPETIKRLTQTKFIAPGVSVSPKHPLASAIVVAGDFPQGIPGMPNKVRRDEFDAAFGG